MALSLSLGTLVTLCRQRANRVGDDTLDEPEWKSLISEYYGEMHALVAAALYFLTDASITANGSATYSLPADHLTTLGIDLVLSGSTGARRPVYGPIMPAERTRLMGQTGEALRWGFEGSSIALYPVPASGTYRHLYIPQPTDYSSSANSTSVDLINIHGRRFLIWGVASVAQHKGSESQVRAMDEHKRAHDDLEYWAGQRAIGQPSYRVPAEDMLGAPDPAEFWVTPA